MGRAELFETIRAACIFACQHPYWETDQSHDEADDDIIAGDDGDW